MMEIPSDHPLFLELPLRRAVVYSEDGGVDWIEALPVILEAYPQMTDYQYWHLTVAEGLAYLHHIEVRKGSHAALP